jgi:hypothetical protein
MERPATVARVDGEFDDFLFSSIGEDRNGVPFSVVSLLARRDLDPWLEAAKLANLPVEAATRQLTRLIQTIAYQPLTLPDPEAIAIRLIALLPRQPYANIQRPTKAGYTVAAALMSPKAIAATIILAICLIFTLGNQLVRSRHAPSTEGNSATAPIVLDHHLTDTPPPPAK